MTVTTTTSTTTTSAASGTSHGALGAAVRSEWIKLTTLRSTVVLVATTAISGFAVAWAVALFVTDEVLLASAVATYSTVLTALLASIGGILAVTAEVQHGTLPAAFAAHPTRWPIIGAKTIVAAGLGVVLGAAGLVAGFAGAVIGGLDVGAASAIGTNIVWALVFTTCSAVLGLGIGMAVRHSTAAVSGLLAWWLVLENLLLVFLPVRAARLLPYVAGGGLLDIESGWEFDFLTRAQNAVVFGTYTAIALGIGAVLLRGRDVH